MYKTLLCMIIFRFLILYFFQLKERAESSELGCETVREMAVRREEKRRAGMKVEG